MKKELQDKLFEKYPELFVQKDWSMQETCMCWGFEVGDGWYHLIDNLCDYITSHCKHNPEIIDKDLDKKLRDEWSKDYNNNEVYKKIKANEKVVIPQVSQVKEKLGELRFYCWENERISGAISLATLMSNSICETCGSTENVNQTEGWIVTLCHKCMEKYKNPKNHNIFKRLYYRIRVKLWLISRKRANAKRAKEK